MCRNDVITGKQATFSVYELCCNVSRSCVQLRVLVVFGDFKHDQRWKISSEMCVCLSTYHTVKQSADSMYQFWASVLCLKRGSWTWVGCYWPETSMPVPHFQIKMASTMQQLALEKTNAMIGRWMSTMGLSTDLTGTGRRTGLLGHQAIIQPRGRQTRTLSGVPICLNCLWASRQHGTGAQILSVAETIDLQPAHICQPCANGDISALLWTPTDCCLLRAH